MWSHDPQVSAGELSLLWEVLTLRTHNTRLVVLATSLLGAASGVVGSFLLLRKRALMGDALAHATLPGLGIAFGVMTYFGMNARSLPGLLSGAVVTGVLGLLLMLAITRTTRLGDDVAMAIVLSVFFGFGVAVMGVVKALPGAAAAGLDAFLYGRPASMLAGDLVWIGGGAALVLVAVFLLFKELAALCFDEAFLEAQGFSSWWMDVVLLALVALVTVIGLQAVGLVLVIAYLIIPAAAARFWTQSLPRMTLVAAAVGAASGWAGATASALLPRMPAGAVIVLVASGFFAVSLLMAPARGLLPRLWRARVLRQRVRHQHVLRAVYEILEQAVREDGPAQGVANRSCSFADLLVKRSWTPRQLRRILAREAGQGHLQRRSGGEVRLSEAGFGEAARVTRNHRLWEAYLVTHADIAPSHVDRDADMVEHILDAEMVARLEETLRAGQAWVPLPPSPHPMGPADRDRRDKDS